MSNCFHVLFLIISDSHGGSLQVHVLVVEDKIDSVVCLTVNVLVVMCLCRGVGGGRNYRHC